MTDPKIGSDIGSYQLLEPIGQGGMGKVYRAKHPSIGKEVAIKFLQGDFAHDSDTLSRFEQEARVANQIKHPNVVDILDFGHTPDGELYMIMELLEGCSLKTLSEESAELPSLHRVCHIALQICSALYASHQKGIIHRDLKSDNIFLIKSSGQEDFVKIFDFGLAKFVGALTSSVATSPGITVGTPLYMSPEQAFGRGVDHQTDIYALGIILYRLMTKTYPFTDKNPFVVASQQISTPLKPPSQINKAINPELERVILRCLEKRKERRYATMEEVAEELCAVGELDISRYFHHRLPSPPKRKPSSNYAALAAGVLLLLATGYGLGVVFHQEASLVTERPLVQEALVVHASYVPPLTQAATTEASSSSEPEASPAKTPKPKNKKPMQWVKGLFSGNR